MSWSVANTSHSRQLIKPLSDWPSGERIRVLLRIYPQRGLPRSLRQDNNANMQ